VQPVTPFAPSPVPTTPASVPTPVQTPATPVVNAAPKPEKPLTPFEMKVKQLEEMGFLNKAKNVELLVKYNGDMVRTVRDLLDN